MKFAVKRENTRDILLVLTKVALNRYRKRFVSATPALFLFCSLDMKIIESGETLEYCLREELRNLYE